MKICYRKDIKFITGVMAAAMTLGGCSSFTRSGDGRTSRHELKEDADIKTEIDLSDVRNTDYDSTVMDKEYRRYCIDLFSQTVNDYGGGDNVIISPASVMMALDMVGAGAKGKSLEQITDLFAQGQGPLTQQAYASALMDRINEAEQVEFTCANAVWNNRHILGDKVNMDYVDYIEDTFNAQYNVMDFNKETADEINKWVDEHTDHMIKDIISDLQPETVMVLVNALCFEAEWSGKYSDKDVYEEDFTSADGTVQTGMFLHDESLVYYESDKATGFVKFYKGGDFAFLAILPTDETISANEFAKNFTAEDYEEFINSKSLDYVVISKMPEFETDFNIEMNDTIEGLGADTVFDPDAADFSGIAGAPGDLYISKIIHKTHIEIDRNGTRAAAATAGFLSGSGENQVIPEYRYVECDRPFVYAIVDVKTMAPVFIGTVNSI